MSNFKSEVHMKDGTIILCDGSESARLPIMIDQIPDAIKALEAAYDKAQFLMANPLLDTSGIDEFMKNYQSTPSVVYRPMVETYQGLLVMLSRLESDLVNTAVSLAALDFESDLEPEISRHIGLVEVCHEKIQAVLQAHKHHIPAIDEHG